MFGVDAIGCDVDAWLETWVATKQVVGSTVFLNDYNHVLELPSLLRVHLQADAAGRTKIVGTTWSKLHGQSLNALIENGSGWGP